MREICLARLEEKGDLATLEVQPARPAATHPCGVASSSLRMSACARTAFASS